MTFDFHAFISSFKKEISEILKDLTGNKDRTANSSLGITYPTLRDHPLHSGKIWLEGRRTDDGAEGFWRIHDNLYDLNSFIKIHPGGRDWIELTKGTDITEAFESYHVTDKPEKLMPKYFLRKSKTPRRYPFTFHENGFYKVLKKNVSRKLASVPKTSAHRSKVLTDALFLSYIGLFFLAVIFRSFALSALAGVCLSLTAIASHNFFHQRDNFRMYYFDFTMMTSRGWRISHALSHHLYTNTINDMEISFVEPFLQYLPTKKNIIFRYVSWIYSPIVYMLVFWGYFFRTIIEIVIDGGKGIRWTLFLPFTVPILTSIITKDLTSSFLIYFWTTIAGSVHFGVVGLNAAHHHPDIFHDGDTPRPTQEMDWGIYQLDAVMDRKDITGSHFLVLTHFGDHALHHLFPTVDHGLLEHLYPVFLETCKEFGVDWRLSSQLELVKGQFRQLAKVEPNKKVPKPVIKRL